MEQLFITKVKSKDLGKHKFITSIFDNFTIV